MRGDVIGDHRRPIEQDLAARRVLERRVSLIFGEGDLIYAGADGPGFRIEGGDARGRRLEVTPSVLNNALEGFERHLSPGFR